MDEQRSNQVTKRKDLTDVKGWLQAARPLPNVRGFMYTPWQRKYELLPAFGDLLKAESR